jgi:hypothetical protein
MVSAESQPRFRRLLQISLTQAKTGPATKKEKPMSSRYRIWIIAAVTIRGARVHLAADHRRSRPLIP